jgi:hypothetical protein
MFGAVEDAAVRERKLFDPLCPIVQTPERSTPLEPPGDSAISLMSARDGAYALAHQGSRTKIDRQPLRAEFLVSDDDGSPEWLVPRSRSSGCLDPRLLWQFMGPKIRTSR